MDPQQTRRRIPSCRPGTGSVDSRSFMSAGTFDFLCISRRRSSSPTNSSKFLLPFLSRPFLLLPTARKTELRAFLWQATFSHQLSSFLHRLQLLKILLFHESELSNP